LLVVLVVQPDTSKEATTSKRTAIAVTGLNCIIVTYASDDAWLNCCHNREVKACAGRNRRETDAEPFKSLK